MKNKENNLKTKSSEYNFKIKELDERTLRFIGSTETKDRQGDIVKVDGWELENYLKNPVFLWAHDSHSLPIGKATNVGIDPTKKALVFDIQFATEEYEFAKTVYNLYKGGFLNATSVGFMIKEWHFDEDTFISDRQELLELSAVPVPANSEALQLAYSKGIVSDNDLSAYKKMLKESEEQDKEDNTMKNQDINIKVNIDTDEAMAKVKELKDALVEIKTLASKSLESIESSEQEDKDKDPEQVTDVVNPQPIESENVQEDSNEEPVVQPTEEPTVEPVVEEPTEDKTLDIESVKSAIVETIQNFLK